MSTHRSSLPAALDRLCHLLRQGRTDGESSGPSPPDPTGILAQLGFTGGPRTRAGFIGPTRGPRIGRCRTCTSRT